MSRQEETQFVVRVYWVFILCC